jgi:hypothetical protein
VPTEFRKLFQDRECLRLPLTGKPIQQLKFNGAQNTSMVDTKLHVQHLIHHLRAVGIKTAFA